MPSSKNKKTILIFFGTRPEVLKLAPLVHELNQSKKFRVKTCLTAQHREMADQVLKLFKVKADYDLKVMRKGQTLSQLTTRLMPKVDRLLSKLRPDLVLVQGDTTSAYLAALQSYYHQIPVGHVEAGLRSFNKYHPFPEEINRVSISHIADFHFAPTTQAQKNLIAGGVPKKKIYLTGNTVVDALNIAKKKLGRGKKTKSASNKKKILLVTAHRRENFGKPLRAICHALKSIARQHADIQIVYPVHMNPRVSKAVKSELISESNISLLKPLRYDQFISLMSESHLILTDSGGIQEEAPSFKVPTLVMRKVTERPEGIRSGFSRLVGTQSSKIIREVNQVLSNKEIRKKMAKSKNPYGDGRASQRIRRILEKALT